MAPRRGDGIVKPDPENIQRQAASRDSSVWVAASAGTGKTKVLTDRVLALLLAGSPPERILCLTFTKAAAAEMAIRVNSRLGDWATISDARLRRALKELTGEDAEPELLGRARRLFARVLDAPGGLMIDTIHAFCQSLLRRFPIEAGVPPHFQVMEERSASEAMEQARSHVLEQARAGSEAKLKSALDRVTQLVPEQGFAELMDWLASERARLESLLALSPEALASKLRSVLGLRPGETSESVLASACREDDFDGAGLRRAAAAMRAGKAKTDREHGMALAAWLENPARREKLFDGYCAVFFTREGARRQRFLAKALADALPDLAASLETEFARLEKVRIRLGAAQMAEATSALLILGRAVLASYRSYKSARALLDFDDLVLKSCALLERPGTAPWVLYKLDGGIDHILIDEAQDTNPEQWRVVAALAGDFFSGQSARDEARTIFAVGDAKQSIFSFQRADPAKFLEMRRHFETRVRAVQAKWDLVELKTSYRSIPAILKTVDAVFASASAADGVSLDDLPIRHESFRSSSGGLVELWPPAGPNELTPPGPWDAPLSQSQSRLPAARLALAVAAKIEALTREKLESKNRRIAPGDIMVLVRRRTPFIGALVRSLKERGVDVAGVDRMYLADQLAIEDMIALANFLLLPEDDLTLACVLKGPLYGFTEEMLFELAWKREGSLWNELRRRAADRPEFRAACDDLAELLGLVDYVPPYELFAEVLGARGGRRKLLARLGPEAGDPLDELLAACLAYERGHGVSLQGFLHWLVLGELEVKRDLNNDSGRDEVRIITVHGAKGLEAPVVFLPDTLQIPKIAPSLVWSASGLPLWLKSGDAAPARAARAEADLKRDQEYRRLLYVALTRAADRLYVCGWHGRQNPAPGNWYEYIQAGLKAAGGESFAFDASKLIGKSDGWKGEGMRLVSRQRGKAELSAKPAPLGQSAKTKLPSWARSNPPPEPAPPKPLAPSRPVTEEPAASSPLGGDGGLQFQRGLLVHRLLQILPGIDPASRAGAARRFLALPVFALPKEQRESISSETLAVLSHPDFADLFSPQSAAEVPIVGLVGGHALSGRIDRLVVTDSEVLIVDYKTLRPVPENESRVPPAYVAQLANYRAAIGGVYPGKKIRCALLWTEGPALMPISDSALARFGA
jgi:ATP-dependent helicase/nuclease subunit A